ncbi:MAG: response regulator transcription factor [Oligoflexales bacterium]
MRILVVEDDVALADLLGRCLREESYAVDIANDGQNGEWMAHDNPYDLVILDIMLPVKNGLDVLYDLRKEGIKTPILLLTAKDGTCDIVDGLDNGADDYLTKPFSLDELTARIRALLRRQKESDPPRLSAGPISIDPKRREISLKGEPLEVTAKEYALLEYFVRNKGHVLSRVQLSEHVWDAHFEPNSNVVDVYVGYVRSKLQKISGTNLIKTVRGHGYMLDVEAMSH